MDTNYSVGVQAYIDRGQDILAAEAAQRARMRRKRFDTIAVHGLYGQDAALGNQGSILEPAYLSTAQHFETSDHMEAVLAAVMPGWTYSRVANPTLHYLEETLAMLEGYGFAGETSACATGSGMAAVLLATEPFLASGGGGPPINIVASAKCYGGTFTLFSRRYAGERGIDVRWVRNPLDLNEWASQIDENTRFLYGEMPSNPGLGVFDIPLVAAIAHAHGLPLIVDSTIATPALLRPLTLGADIVVHSVTKLMTTSGFAIAGAVIARRDIPSRVGPDEMRHDYATYVKLEQMRDYGPSLSPFSALMIMNDLRMVRTRADIMSRNAQRIAEFLAAQSSVEGVNYPGLPDFAGHDVAKRVLWLADGEDDYGAPVNRFGHLLSFSVNGGAEAARAVFDRLQMIWRATDLGRVKTVAAIPAISTHQKLGDEGRAIAEVSHNLIRLSIGAEHPADIMADLEQALAGSVGTPIFAGAAMGT